jgi:hypothetical protein
LKPSNKKPCATAAENEEFTGKQGDGQFLERGECVKI